MTSTQKQLALQKGLYLREMGIPISTGYLIDNMNLPDKKKVIEETMQQEQMQQQMQMQQMQTEMEQKQLLAQAAMAEANSKNALAAERMNKVQLDAALSAERMQRADEDRTGSVLNLIKALKEIQGMDLEQMETGLRIVQQMEGTTTEHMKINAAREKTAQPAQNAVA